MERTVSEVARLTGVTVRTLRHYDAIGLLPPGHVAPNGYRYYGRPELLRLQRILLLRELDVPLSAIGRILAEQEDEIAALRDHREQLLQERRRLDAVIGSVDRTLQGLAGDESVGDEEFFAGLSAGRSRLQRDLTERFGPEVGASFEAAVQATAGWVREDYERMADEGRRLLLRLAAARARGVQPDSAEALELMALHYQGVRELWQADATGYYRLGDVLLDNADQRAMIASVDPELPPWLSAAVKAYAIRKLGYKTVDGPV
ncbi:MerR family transcriptional regulator [Kribbella sp. NPDC020789]